MRSLSSEQKELIEALVAEYDPRYPDITPGLLEKDEHLTAALRALFNLSMPRATLVFCGGTSLSKAYRLIDRMSEDADLKIVLSADSVSQSKNQQQKQLSKLKELVSNELTKEGFSISHLSAQNENRYIRIDLEYARAYPTAAGLRPHLQIELTTKPIRLDTQTLNLNSLTRQLLNMEEGGFEVAVLSLPETLAEKILSFLRRFAQYRAGSLKHEWDQALVRHIYDTHCIVQHAPSSAAEARSIFHAMIEDEKMDWANQFPEFAQDAHTVLLNSLEAAEQDTQVKREYQNNLLPLIYGNVKPNFEVAFRDFKQTSQYLLDSLV